MIAPVFVAAPKSRPEAGWPPITPGSAVRVTWLSSPSSAAAAATPSGIPIPRFTTPPTESSKAVRRAITLRLVSGRGAAPPVGAR